MENAADALIMAGSMLIFLIALSVCMSSFSTVRQGVDNIMGQTETVDMAQLASGEYLNYLKGNTNAPTRVVGAETVIAAMYRCLKENSDIYIKFKSSTPPTLESSDVKIEYENEYKPDTHSGIPVGKIIKISLNKNDRELRGMEYLENNQAYKELMEKLYNAIVDKKFNEYLGEYKNDSEVSEENKLAKRIITYAEK